MSDVEMVTFAGKHRMLIYPTAALLTGRSEGALRNRLPRLVRAGLLDCYLTPIAGAVFVPTQDGLDLAGLPLTVSLLRLGQMRHALAAARLAAVSQHEGKDVYGDRQIRSAAHAAYRVGSPIGGGPQASFGGYAPEAFVIPWANEQSPIGHIPDLVALDPASGEVCTTEVEMSRKPRQRWQEVALATLGCPWVDRLEYAAHPDLLTSIYDAVRYVPGCDSRIGFTPIHSRP